MNKSDIAFMIIATAIIFGRIGYKFAELKYQKKIEEIRDAVREWDMYG